MSQPALTSAPLAEARPARNRVLALRLLPGLLAQAARVYPAGEAQALRRRWRFVASAMRHPRAHACLLDFLSAPRWRTLLARHPRLLQKVHKPFPCRGTTVDERVAILCRHLELAGERLGDAAIDALADGRELEVGRVALPAGAGELAVRLGRLPRFEREGELTLSLIDPFGSLLYSACFTLVERDGVVALLVGSLNGTAPLDVVRHLTKLSLGLRPQALMLFLLQQAAAATGAGALLAVGRDSHAYWGHPRHAEIRFDYDGFWEEAGGTRRDDGLWSLPVQPARRAPAEIAANKRSQYQRRYAWLDAVAADVAARWPRGTPSGPDAA